MTMVFLFLLLLGKHFGMGLKTDSYFFSLMIVNYLSYFVQATWKAMQPYYIKEKIENPKSASELYSVLLNSILFFSVVIILFYFLLTNTLIELEAYQKDFLDIYIFYILVQNILLFNKSILNLEKYFVSYYLVDIFIYSINIFVLLLFLEDDIKPLAYSMIIATTLALLWQFYLIFNKISISYFFQRKHDKIKSVYKNSTKEKFSGLLYGLKEPLLAMIFLSLGEGVYSLFNYAHKFSAAIYQVTSAPVINRFISKIHYLVAQKNYISIDSQIKTALWETVPIFIISIIAFYLSIPFSMSLFFADTLTTQQINQMQNFYLYMSIFYLVISFEAPFATTFSAFKLFNYKLLLNGLFFLFICSIYLLFKLSSFDYYIYLLILILAQTTNLLLYVNKSKKYLKEKL